MYKKNNKKLEKKYIISIILLFIAIFIGLSVSIIRTDRKLTAPEKIIKDTALFINKVLYAPIKFVKDKASETKNKNNIYEKYMELEKDKQEIDLLKSQNAELKKEHEQMKKLLDLDNSLTENTYLNATVINRNLNYFSNTMTIDKGEKNQVEVDMAVIVSNGLVGKILSTSNFNSTVKLLTSNDINNKISVKIESDDKYIYGLLSGYDEKNKYLLIEGISTNEPINENSVVTTTGFGDVFPSGILVGKVVGTKKDSFDLATTVLVKSAVDFDNLNFVTVLKRKTK